MPLRQWLKSTNFAIEGILQGAKTQRHLRYHFFTTGFVLVLSYILGITRTEFIVISLAVGKDESALLGALPLNPRCSCTNRIDEDFNSAVVTTLITLAHADGHQVSVVQFKVLNEVLANNHCPCLH